MKSIHSKNQTLESIVDRIGQLPMLPGVLFKLLQLDPEDDQFYDRMLELAKSDPPLAAFIIGYSNSAISSPNTKIDSLQVALTRIGSTTVINLLTTLSVSKVFIPVTNDHKSIWRHSVEVAHLSSFIAKLIPGEHLKPELAYLSGLLHDIGRFVLFELFPEGLNETNKQGWSSPDEFVNAEMQAIGFTHAKVGYLACKKLDLPNLIGLITRYHHNKEIIMHPKASEELKSLSLVVQVADMTSMFLAKNEDWRTWSNNQLEDNIHSYCIHTEWNAFDLPIKSLVSVLPTVIDKSSNTCRTLGV